jgi:hypothetical protein
MGGIPGYRLAWRKTAPGEIMRAMQQAHGFQNLHRWWSRHDALFGQHVATAVANGMGFRADALQAIARTLAARVAAADGDAALKLLDEISVTLATIAVIASQQRGGRSLMSQQQISQSLDS